MRRYYENEKTLAREKEVSVGIDLPVRTSTQVAYEARPCGQSLPLRIKRDTINRF